MANWTISPCGEGIATPCNCDDGNFTISPNVKSGKSFKITYTDGEKVKTIDYVREKECITCECSDIIFEYKYHLDNKGRKVEERYFNVDKHDNVELGTIKFKEGTTCANYVRVSGDTGSTGFTEIKIVGDKVIASFPAYQQTFDETGRRLRFKFTIEGTPCTNTYEIYQQAWKGTDNGMDFFANGFKLDYPIQLCGCGDPTDGDSIVAENGAWLYVPESEQFVEIDKNAFERVYPNGYVVDGWCKFTAGDKNDPNPDARGICKVGMIHIEALSDNPSSTEVRKTQIILASVNSKDASPVNVASNAPASWHPGEQCALKWSYDVWQLPKGYSDVYADNGIDFNILTNEELQNCIDYNNCKYQKMRDCRGEGYNCKK